VKELVTWRTLREEKRNLCSFATASYDLVVADVDKVMGFADHNDQNFGTQ